MYSDKTTSFNRMLRDDQTFGGQDIIEGHYAGYSGTIYHGSFIGTHPNSDYPTYQDTPWILGISTPDLARINGITKTGTCSYNPCRLKKMSINYIGAGETTDHWEIAEVILFDKLFNIQQKFYFFCKKTKK